MTAANTVLVSINLAKCIHSNITLSFKTKVDKSFKTFYYYCNSIHQLVLFMTR